VEVTARASLPAAVTPYNIRYLTTKRDRLGHQIQNLSEAERAVAEASGHLSEESLGRAAG